MTDSMLATSRAIDVEDTENRYYDARAFLQVYVTNEHSHIINIFSDDEEVLRQLISMLQSDFMVEGPNNYIGTPALTLYCVENGET